MEMKHLQYFIEVTRAGSFTHAAEKLYMTQPAISRIIKSLEDELEASLFIRSRKKLSLTDAGKILYEHAQVMEKQFQALRLELESLSFLKKAIFVLACPRLSIPFSSLN